MVMNAESRTINMGSRLFYYPVPLIAATLTDWYDIYSTFGNEARLFDFFDSLMITNNSALPVHFYLDTANDDYLVLAYSQQPINRRAFRRFGLYNPDLGVDIAAGEITLAMRRLPPDVISVIPV